MKQFLCLLAMLWLSIPTPAQNSLPSAALDIGDTLPDLLLTNVINHSESSLRIGDGHPRLLLLDFWSASCGPCFRALPNMDSLQKADANIRIITITSGDSAARIRQLMQRIPGLSQVRLPILVHDSILHAYFPHLLISHVVWLDSSRRVIAMTGTDYVTGPRIREAIAGGAGAWPVKRDIFSFDYTQPFLVQNPDVTITPSFQYLSAFTSQLEGIAPPSRILRDSIRGETRFSLYNLNLLSLCQLVVDFSPSYKPELFSLKLEHPERFFKPRDMPLSDWMRDNSFCYTTTLPLDITPSRLGQLVQQDIRRWLELMNIKIRPLKNKQKPSVRYEILENSF